MREFRRCAECKKLILPWHSTIDACKDEILHETCAYDADWLGGKPILEVDHCGPAGTGIFARALSALIPDYIGFGPRRTYIGDCCQAHDTDNDLYGANKHGDEALKDCIRCRLKEMFYNSWEIAYYSNKYFWGVRLGNPFYKKPKELLKDIVKEFKRKFK